MDERVRIDEVRIFDSNPRESYFVNKRQVAEIF